MRYRKSPAGALRNAWLSFRSIVHSCHLWLTVRRKRRCGSTTLIKAHLERSRNGNINREQTMALWSARVSSAILRTIHALSHHLVAIGTYAIT